MERINLLSPQTRTAEPAAKARTVPAWALGLLVLLLMGSATGAWLHLWSLDTRLARQQDTLSSLEAKQPEQAALLREAEGLEAEAAALLRVQNPLPPAAVIALLARVLPEEVSLGGFVLETLPQHLLPRTAGRARGTAEPTGSDDDVLVTLRLSGWAADEIVVASALEQISASGVLGEARLVHARPDEREPDRQAFQIEARRGWALSEAR